MTDSGSSEIVPPAPQQKDEPIPGQFIVAIGNNISVTGHFCIVIGDNLNVVGVFQVVMAETVTFNDPDPKKLRFGIQFMTQFANEINTRKGYPTDFVKNGTIALQRGIHLYTEQLQTLGEVTIPNDDEKLSPINFGIGIVVMGNRSMASGPFGLVIGDDLTNEEVCGISTGIPVTIKPLHPDSIPDAITIFSRRIAELDNLPGFPPGYVEKARPLICWLMDTCCKGAYSLLANNGNGNTPNVTDVE